MSLTSALFGFLENHTALSYLVLFLGSFLDTSLGIGLFLPGEVFFITGAVLSGLGYLNPWLVYVFLVFGGILADNISFVIGDRYGESVHHRLFKKENRILNYTNYGRAKRFFIAYGDKAVFLSRLLGPISKVTPLLAGVFHIKHKKFFIYNAAGVCLGIGQFMVAGYIFGAAYLQIHKFISRYLLIGSIAVVALLFLLYILDRKIGLGWIRRKLVKKFMEHAIIYSIAYVIVYLSILYISLAILN